MSLPTLHKAVGKMWWPKPNGSELSTGQMEKGPWAQTTVPTASRIMTTWECWVKREIKFFVVIWDPFVIITLWKIRPILKLWRERWYMVNWSPKDMEAEGLDIFNLRGSDAPSSTERKESQKNWNLCGLCSKTFKEDLLEERFSFCDREMNEVKMKWW